MCKKKSIIFDEGVVRTRLLPVFKYVKGQNIPSEGNWRYTFKNIILWIKLYLKR